MHLWILLCAFIHFVFWARNGIVGVVFCPCFRRSNKAFYLLQPLDSNAAKSHFFFFSFCFKTFASRWDGNQAAEVNHGTKRRSRWAKIITLIIPRLSLSCGLLSRTFKCISTVQHHKGKEQNHPGELTFMCLFRGRRNPPLGCRCRSLRRTPGWKSDFCSDNYL